MSAPAERMLLPPASALELTLDTNSDRRADVLGKQAWVASLLRETGCEGLLVLDPENFTWLSSGGASRGALDSNEQPVLYFSHDQRWVLAGNVDSQRLFDEELDGLGFQLKEWPWHWGREQLLADLCQKRRVASDRINGDAKVVATQLYLQRRTLTAYEQACYRSLGKAVSHALEATCRNLVPGLTEREIAGQLGHRLLHRGVSPLVINVGGDGRSRLYRQCGFTPSPVSRYCMLSVSGRKYGLCVTASRTVSFGPLDDTVRQEHEAACKIAASYAASTWPDAVPREILNVGRRIYQVTGYEHEWRQCPQGHVTGRIIVESPLTPRTEELLQNDWVVTRRASVGAASCCDTYLVGEEGPQIMTPTEGWPLRRVRFQGLDFSMPFPLER